MKKKNRYEVYILTVRTIIAALIGLAAGAAMFGILKEGFGMDVTFPGAALTTAAYAAVFPGLFLGMIQRMRFENRN